MQTSRTSSADGFQYITRPEVMFRSNIEDRNERVISNLIGPWDGKSKPDVAFLMVPYSKAGRTSTNSSAAGPNALRQIFTTHRSYNPDLDVDIANLKLVDLGDVRWHMTDVLLSHKNMEEAVVEAYQRLGDVLLIMIGGDHSISCPLVQGYSRARPEEKIGIILFDSHYDMRSFDEGPNSGTPFRGIIEGPANVEGRNIVEIGLHGFMSSSLYKRYCEEKGVSLITHRHVRKRGIEAVIEEAIRIASDGTNSIYVSFDMDVMSRAYVPGTGNSSPEGLEAWDAVEAMFLLGQQPKVKAMDLVELDPMRDAHDCSARMSAGIVLSFLAGYVLRSTGGRGY